jgi:cytochrome d ubiquinol oxidase subunit I
VPETLFGWLNSDGEVVGGIPIPGLASILSDPTQGTDTQITGLDAFPEEDRPTTRQVNIVHLAWDVMVGIGTMLFLLALWFGVTWLFRRDLPRTRWFLRVASVAGVASVLAMEAGWVVTEVGRQPWIVFDYMKVEEAATGNDGVWLTFLVICGVYAVVAVSLVLVLRLMARRFAAADEHPDEGGPYAPRTPPRVEAGVS